MLKTAEFVIKHINDDVTRLILEKGKWPEIDMDLAVNSIESRRKLRGKVNEWYDNPHLIFPARLSAEQCSSSATGRYKAELAERMVKETGTDTRPWNIADFTGGLGVDSWFFSRKAENVLYCEMQKPLCEAAVHNFKSLKADNIAVKECKVGKTSEDGCTSIPELLGDFHADIVYMDPARRGEGGKKVFLIEDCTPDVLTLKDDIFKSCRHILLKLSPMADITMACSRLGNTCREVHTVATGGECKELLIWMDREWNGDYSVTAVEIHNDSAPATFTFCPCDEKEAIPLSSDGRPEGYLFEPGKSLMKSGAFNLISSRFGIFKLGHSTHYYTTADIAKVEPLKQFGKIFRIIRCEPLNKKSIRCAGSEFPKADVTARNIPMDSDTLRKKLGVTSGQDIHIFGLKSDTKGNILLITHRL